MWTQFVGRNVLMNHANNKFIYRDQLNINLLDTENCQQTPLII